MTLTGGRIVWVIVDDVMPEPITLAEIEAAWTKVSEAPPPLTFEEVMANHIADAMVCVERITRKKGPPKRTGGKHVSKWDRWS